MTWSRPISVLLAPALLLALGVAVLLLDGFGIPSSLGNRLFDTYQRHTSREIAGSSRGGWSVPTSITSVWCPRARMSCAT